MKEITEKYELADGRIISIETGLLAQLAHGSAVVRMGKVMLLATVVSNKEPRQDATFLPLSVDYQEKYASNGKIPGGFLKREGRLNEDEILISRLIDRALRPLFPEHYYCETQVMISLLSADAEVKPDALACLAASAALMLSDIPFKGPVAEVRVARANNSWVINPSQAVLDKADIDLMVAGTIENIIMVEGEMNEVSEEEMVEAIKEAHKTIIELCHFQNQLAERLDKTEIRTPAPVKSNDGLREVLFNACQLSMESILADTTKTRSKKQELLAEIKDSFIETLSEEIIEENEDLIHQYFNEIKKEVIRNTIIDNGIRIDNRKTDQIRPISIRTDYLPSAHGSALFTRGETQSLTTVTLGNKRDEQLIDGAIREGSNRFMLHYNFPPFSTGEAKMMRGTSRREVGHGNLALRTIKRILPGEEDCPFTIRIVSDILQSNGSSSMATVCAASLALMDAGIPVKKAVAGIAMGLIQQADNYVILSDILGDEDHIGDMDFKVTGTTEGITACQMDIKVEGLPYEVLLKALYQAKKGRNHILGCMNEALAQPVSNYKPHAPKIERFSIPKKFIGAVIGSGGKVIQELQKNTNTTISVEENGELGFLEICGTDAASMREAREYIDLLIKEPKPGEEYNGVVKNIVAFGAFLEILPGKQGLLHISDYSWDHIEDLNDHLSIGSTLKVKVSGIDSRNGKLKLNRKELLEKV